MRQLACLPLVLLAISAGACTDDDQKAGAGARPTADAPIVVAGEPIARDVIDRRAKAFDDNQSFSGPSAVRPYVVRQMIDERWALRDAAEAGIEVTEADVDAALMRSDARTEQERRERAQFYGTDEAGLRERVRADLLARLLADRILRRTRSDAAYGRAFLARLERRRRATACRAPYTAADRCRGARRSRFDTGPHVPLGVGKLSRWSSRSHQLELDLAPMLGLYGPDFGYGKARARLEAVLRRSAPAVLRRVRLSNDASAVYAEGRRGALFAVARAAHRMVQGRPAPVLG